MDLNFLSGQLMMVGFHGVEFSEEHEELLKVIKPSGIILFKRNIVDPKQLAGLIKDFQAFAKKIGLPPLIVSIDYEGGIVVRISRGATSLPSLMAISATRRIECARIVAEIAAKELKAIGINMNLAPVVDVNTNPVNPIIGVRSFGDDPIEVAAFSEAYIKSLQSNGVMAVAKHFPGHGDTSVDSHLDLPVLNLSLEEMVKRELIPFKAAVEAGVSSIMAAHIAYPKIDESGLPATLSKPIVGGILRGMLGFDGVVMTDALEMKAIRDRFEPKEIVALALNAGVDLLLPASDYDLMIELKDEIIKGVEAGRIDKHRLIESYARIESLRREFGLYSYRFDPAALSVVGCNSHRKAVLEIAVSSITVVKDEGLLPLSGGLGRLGIAVPDKLAGRLGAEHGGIEVLLNSIFSGKCEELSVQIYSVDPSREEVEGLLGDLEFCDAIIVFTYNALLNPGQIELVNRVDKLGNAVIVASRDPYDVKAFPQVKCFIATYGITLPQLEALVRILFGELQAGGRLPVNIDDVFARVPLVGG
ncbi:MAG: beta-N-acetylhexosaminidase [archaeon GB-1867-005]|nr:beta-N-acetylhexosaminidase [Candidatus Culexmicrobium cathedralense]